MKGFKGFDKDLKCRDMQYEVGKEYKFGDKLEMCNSGFHFCQKITDVHEYYNLKQSRICEIEAIGEIITDKNKSVTNHIKIIRELSKLEILELVNNGKDNTGLFNSGSRNSGNWNSGDLNSGSRNSGDRNSGDLNSGNFCSCDNSAGLFMSKRISYEAFNKSLSEQEYNKITNSNGYSICKRFQLVRYRVRTKTGKFGDYRYLPYKKSWKIFWNNLTFTERNLVRKMPHIDKAVFEEITGVKL